MANRYRHHKPTPDEFHTLMDRGGVSLNDFLFLTGRQAMQVLAFLNSTEVGGPKNPRRNSVPYSPTMGDVLILELAAAHPELVDAMTEIANKYAFSVEEVEQLQADRAAAKADGDKPPGDERYWP